MQTLTETQIISSVHLSDTQKVVMAKILAAPTSQVASEEIAGSPNAVTASQVLVKLKLLTYTDKKFRITDTGYDVMKDENLVDDQHQLNDEGTQYANVKSPNDIKDIKDPKPADTTEGDAGISPEQLPPNDQMESLTLLHSINNQLHETEALARINKVGSN